MMPKPCLHQECLRQNNSKRMLCGVLAFIILLLAPPASAWNATGHRIIAAIAYDRLTPAARTKVDEMIRNHPDYNRLFVIGAPEEPSARARYAFQYAATWPDVIRGDMRFYDETRKDFMETPLLPGFTSMSRHVVWHYYDIPHAPDGAKKKLQLPPHALSELRRMLSDLGKLDAAHAAYDLPWLEHLEGDVHQPLHATSRFLKAQPMGDAGGNFVFVAPNSNLHAYWDNAAGTDTTDSFIDRSAKEIATEFPGTGGLNLNPNRWLKESYSLDKSEVYSFGLATGTREQPITLPSDYAEKAKKIARRRLAEAGYRLAEILNQSLK